MREWTVLFTSLAKCEVAVRKVDDVSGSAEVIKLWRAVLSLPHTFLPVRTC